MHLRIKGSPACLANVLVCSEINIAKAMPITKKAQILSVGEVHRASIRVKASRVAAAPAAEGDADSAGRALAAAEPSGAGPSSDENDEESDAFEGDDADEDEDPDDGGDGDDEEEEEDLDEDDDEEEVVTPRKRAARSGKSHATPKRKRQKPRAARRDPDSAGKVLICPETLPFLRDLASHTNDRDWFVANKPRWQDIKSEFEIFVDYLKDRARVMDPALPDCPAKSCIFRINRDVRFSGGPLYKKHVSCAFPKKNFPPDHPGCFFFKIEPGKSRVAAGIWDVQSGKLAAIRAAIDADNGAAVRAVLGRDSFKEMFGEDPLHALTPDGEPYNESLKTAPKGYKKDHEAIDLLRLKSFGIKRDVDDDVVAGEDFMDVIIATWTELMPWILLLNTYAS
ncbi:hypothetical protein HK101_000388 [Irineochytrium annulatum]|nr:hypothetical protein HK101_000388 [Irineochytrium annulatum]